MQGKSAARYGPFYLDWANAVPVLRYAAGSALILAVASGSGYTLSYLTPVLALNFFAPGQAPLKLRAGIGFVASLALASIIGILFSRLFLEFPLAFIPLLSLAMFYLYYSDRIKPLFRIWLVISLLLIPLLSSFSNKLGAVIALTLVQNAAIAILLVWFIFLLFPYHEPDAGKASMAPRVKPGPRERYRSALKSTAVLLPMLIGFFLFQWAGSILVLVFVTMLSMNPRAASFRSGLLMIIANLAGGLAAIVAFNLLVIVPEIIFLVLITLLAGLIFGRFFFSEKPTARLFGTGFSTFLLVLGSVTTTDGEAGEKVWSRIFQIGVAVVYVVVAFGLLDHFTKPRKTHGG